MSLSIHASDPEWRNPLMVLTMLILGLGITFGYSEPDLNQTESAAMSWAIPSTSSLKPGVYWGGGSRYIKIAAKNGQLWFTGFSPRGTWTAQLRSRPGRPGQYQIDGSDIFVQQLDSTTLLFDNIPYQLEV